MATMASADLPLDRTSLDALADDVARLRKAGHSIRQIAELLKRSKAGVEKALARAKAHGLLPLSDDNE